MLTFRSAQAFSRTMNTNCAIEVQSLLAEDPLSLRYVGNLFAFRRRVTAISTINTFLKLSTSVVWLSSWQDRFGSIGFRRVHKRMASDNWAKFHLSQSGSVLTRSPRMVGSLSNVIVTLPSTVLILFIVCNACTQWFRRSLNSQIFRRLALGIYGNSTISFTRDLQSLTSFRNALVKLL